MARLFAIKPEAFAFPEKEAYLNRVADWVRLIRPELYIDRIVGDAPFKFVVNKGWGVRLDVLVREFEALLDRRNIYQGEQFPLSWYFQNSCFNKAL